jgi:hypothetical protein
MSGASAAGAESSWFVTSEGRRLTAPIVATTEISRSRDDVFAYVTDPRRLPDWQESVVRAKSSDLASPRWDHGACDTSRRMAGDDAVCRDRGIHSASKTPTYSHRVRSHHLVGQPAPALHEREGRAPATRLAELGLRFRPQVVELVRCHQRKQSLLEGGRELERQTQIGMARR